MSDDFGCVNIGSHLSPLSICVYLLQIQLHLPKPDLLQALLPMHVLLMNAKLNCLLQWNELIVVCVGYACSGFL